MSVTVDNTEEEIEKELKKTRKTKKVIKNSIRVYPKKEYVGWLIPIHGYGRFQPQSEEDYVKVPAEAREDVLKSRFVEVRGKKYED